MRGSKKGQVTTRATTAPTATPCGGATASGGGGGLRDREGGRLTEAGLPAGAGLSVGAGPQPEGRTGDSETSVWGGSSVNTVFWPGETTAFLYSRQFFDWNIYIPVSSLTHAGKNVNFLEGSLAMDTSSKRECLRPTVASGFPLHAAAAGHKGVAMETRTATVLG